MAAMAFSVLHGATIHIHKRQLGFICHDKGSHPTMNIFYTQKLAIYVKVPGTESQTGLDGNIQGSMSDNIFSVVILPSTVTN